MMDDTIEVSAFTWPEDQEFTADTCMRAIFYSGLENPRTGKDASGAELKGEISPGRVWIVLENETRAEYNECFSLMEGRLLLKFTGTSDKATFNRSIGEFQAIAASFFFPDIEPCASYTEGDEAITLPENAGILDRDGADNGETVPRGTLVTVLGEDDAHADMVLVEKEYAQTPVFPKRFLIKKSEVGRMGCEGA
jgi:hypothetical protein